jgi:hypothetical protein
MTAKKESLNIGDLITIATPIGKVSVTIDANGIFMYLEKPNTTISVKIDGTNVSSGVFDKGSHSSSQGGSQQVQIINGRVNGAQISQSNGDSIQIQTNNRYR